MSVNLHPHYGDTLENLDFWGPLDTLPYSLDDPLWPSRAALEIKGSSLSPGRGGLNGRLKGYGWTRIPPPVHAPWRSRQV